MSAPEPWQSVIGHCPRCGPNRRADVVGHYHRRDTDDSYEENGVWSEIDYRILKCRGCDSVYFQTEQVFSEDVEYRCNPRTGENEGNIPHKIFHWPLPSKKNQPKWSSKLYRFNNELDSLFEEIYIAFNNDLRILSTIGIRTVFDRSSELIGVDPSKAFIKKLDELVNLGKIGAMERETLDILVNSGSAAAHRGWKPEPDELDTIMNILETFIFRTFVLNDEAKALMKKIPAKQNR